MQNIITKFDEAKSDAKIFDLLKQSVEIRKGETNVVLILPRKMQVLQSCPQLLLQFAEGVIGALPGQPKAGVTFVRNIKGLSANIGAGTIKGRLSGYVKVSAQISNFFEY